MARSSSLLRISHILGVAFYFYTIFVAIIATTRRTTGCNCHSSFSFSFWLVQAMTTASSISSNSKPATMSSQKPLIIFCHGSGDTGEGVKAWIESLVPSYTVLEQWDWIFPSAKPIPYTLNGGMISNVWYNRIGGFDPTFPEEITSIEQSTTQLLQLIDDEVQHNGRDPRRIILGGFSMGGAIAYQTAIRWQARLTTDTATNTTATAGRPRQPLGAIFGLSCYLNDNSKVWSILQNINPIAIQQWPPTFIAHGEIDDFILPKWGKSTYEKLFQSLGMIDIDTSSTSTTSSSSSASSSSSPSTTFRLLPNTHHDMTQEEIRDLLEFLSNAVPLV